MAKVSKIKTTISSFLLGEEGKISKQSALAIGTMLATAGIAAAQHTSTSTIQFQPPATEVGIHTSHTSHSSCGCGCGCGCY